MDARERLRLYLEQRRELGEQELVLDRLDVDDVLRLVGALGAAPASPAAGAPSRRPPPDTADLGRPASAVREDAAGADGARTNSGRADVVDGERTRSASGEVTAAGRGSSPPDERRPEEPMGSLVDWRETLRAAGGGPPGLVTPPVAKRQGEPEKGEGEGEMARRKKADSATTEEPSEVPGPAAPPRGTRKTASKAEAASGGAPVQLPSWAAELDIPAGLSVGDSGALDATFARLRSLDELARVTEGCTRCPLYRTATHAVPGDGNPDADLVCVGEAPGANEDASGRPFVGAAGQLLTKILAAIKLSREDVFICNVLKHRPPGNRNPAPDEVEACSPYLLRQLELVKPKVILTLGTFAAQTLLATKTPIGKLRGQVHLYHGIPLVVTYHPAALLRNSAWKRPTWEDVQLARRLLDRAPGSGA